MHPIRIAFVTALPQKPISNFASAEFVTANWSSPWYVRLKSVFGCAPSPGELLEGKCDRIDALAKMKLRRACRQGGITEHDGHDRMVERSVRSRKGSLR